MLPAGTRIGQRYVIERLLGQGGMSNLYIATDLTQGGATRVIKEMTARYSDPNEQKMAENLFMREAQLLATLNHPHIPKVFDKFIFQGKYYLSMEYVQGEDLSKLIQDRGTIEEKWVAAWGAQMATVLYYLHRQNPPIVFRDVKPSNIMIVNEQVKLIDFGIARLFTSAKKGDTMRIGSPGYAPPEQYGGQTDPRSDIYALGVTLHHAATGYDPTVSQQPFVIPPARTLNPKVSAEMETLITRATQLDPDKRYQNCLDMKRDLQNVMRMHGMIVGTSMPFSALQPGAAPATPPPGATVPKLPPSAAAAAAAPPTSASPAPGAAAVVAGVAGAALATGAVGAAAVTGAASAASATPAASQPPAGATVSPSPKKRSLAPVFLALAVLGIGVGAAKAPAQWRDAASQQVQVWIGELKSLGGPPKSELSDAQKVMLWGGPIGLAAEELGKEVRQGQATALQSLDYQNALAYASGRPVRAIVVVAPAELKLAETLAFWQRQSWEDPGREGALPVVTLVEVSDNWRAALKQAQSGERLRQGISAQAVVVVPPEKRPPGWETWFKDVPNLYWAAPKGPQDPPQAKALEVDPPDLGVLLKNSGLGPAAWMAKQPPPPSGITPSEFPTAEGLARLVKTGSNQRTSLVVDLSQLQAMNNWPKLSGVDLITFLEPEQLRQPPPKAPQGAKLYALTSGHPFCEYPVVRAYFTRNDLYTPVYDRLGWVVLRPDEDGPRTGLSWRSDRSGKLMQPHWSLLEARPGGWCWVKELEARP